MKKVLIALLLTVVSVGAFAQQGSVSGHAKIGYQSEAKRFGVGVEGRYEIIDNLRIAPDVTFYFPKHKVMGLDINLNAQYTFKNVLDKLTIYPLAGLNIANNRLSSQTYHNPITGKDEKSKSQGSTDFGFNLGVGADYDITSSSYLNFDIKYTFGDLDFAQFMFGYGLRF